MGVWEERVRIIRPGESGAAPSETEAAGGEPTASRGAGLDGVEWWDVASPRARRGFCERYIFAFAGAGPEARLRWRRRELERHEGGVVVVEPGDTYHSIRTEPGGRAYALMLDPECFAPGGLFADRPAPHFRVGEAREPEVASSFAVLAALLESGGPTLAIGEAVVTAVAAATARLGEASQSRPAPRANVQRAIDLILGRLEENVTLRELADVASVSGPHLLRAFRQQVGLPPHQFQLHARVARAHTLLRRGMALADVAQTLGFCDQSHLTRQFKRVLGVTPGRYARAG